MIPDSHQRRGLPLERVVLNTTLSDRYSTKSGSLVVRDTVCTVFVTVSKSGQRGTSSLISPFKSMAFIELESGGVSNLHVYNQLCDEENDILSVGANSPTAMLMDSESSSKPLIQHCANNWTTTLFLRATGNYWHSDGKWCSFDRIFYGIARFINGASVFYYFAYLVKFVAKQPPDYLSAGIDLAIIVRTVSVLPVQFLNQQRLLQPACEKEAFVLEESSKMASIFGLIAILTNIIATVLFAYSNYVGGELFFLTEHFLTAYLSFSLFFLIVDTKASSLLLDDLHDSAESKTLTLEAFVRVREDIHRKVKDSRWACDLIFVPCIASIAVIVVLVLFGVDTHESQADKNGAIGFIFLMLKELFFVAVAFVYVAKVNARADELTVELSRTSWCSRKNETAQHLAVCPSSGDALALDVERLSIHASGLSEPISFTLLFKRVSWRNVMIGAGGFVVTILIAIIKSIVETDMKH